MKKLLTLLLTLFMVFTLVGCNSKEDTPVVQEPEKQEEVVEPAQEEIIGGYVDVEDGTLTDELKDIFNKALEGLTGATYEPQELVATQVVAGTNYKFLANGTKTTNPITKGTYYIYIYEDLQGNVELKDIEVIEEKQEEVKTQDVTQMYFWIVYYDQNGNELQRTAEKYGTIPSFKGTLPEGFIKWKYKKTGKDVTMFLPIITNTYFIAEQTTSSKPIKTPTYHIEYLDEAGFIFSGEHENGYPTIHTYGKDTILKSAFKYGYEFEGWYEDYECDGDPITVLKAKDYTDDIFLYAKWKQITTTVNCYVYDNTASTEKEYVPLKDVKIMYDVENGGTYFGTTSEYGFAQLEVPSYEKGYFKVSKPGYETIVLDPVTYGDKQIANEYFWMDRSVATISLISKHGHFKGITTAQDNVDSINVYVGQYFSANCNGYIYVADDKFGTNVKVYQFVADEGYAFSSFNPTIPYTKVYKSFNIIAKTNKLKTVTFYAGTPDEMYKGAAITSIDGDWNFTEGRKAVECTFVASTKDKDIIKNFNKNCETNYNGYELKEWTRKTGTNDFYPTWIAKEYEVTFISGVESLGNQKINETYDSKYMLPAKSPIKTGYEFVGWFTSEEGGTQVTTETIVKITEPTSLYAHYSPITYQTIFKGNYEGSTYEITLDETYDSKFVLPEVNPTRDGYMFAGWYTKAEGGNLITNETIVDASIRKAYAHWTDATETTEYIVTFDLNGISGTAPTSQTIKDGEKVKKPADPTDTVHTFAGWYKTKDSTTGALSDPWDFDNGTVTANMTLYAQWTRTLESIYTNSDIPKVTNNSAPDNAWVNGEGGKAFIAYSTGNTVLYLYKQLQPSGAKQLSCGKTENFTKIGDDYVLDYYLQRKFYGKYTLHMTEGKFTSVTYNGAGTDYEVLSGTYAPIAN